MQATLSLEICETVLFTILLYSFHERSAASEKRLRTRLTLPYSTDPYPSIPTTSPYLLSFAHRTSQDANLQRSQIPHDSSRCRRVPQASSIECIRSSKHGVQSRRAWSSRTTATATGSTTTATTSGGATRPYYTIHVYSTTRPSTTGKSSSSCVYPIGVHRGEWRAATTKHHGKPSPAATLRVRILRFATTASNVRLHRRISFRECTPLAAWNAFTTAASSICHIRAWCTDDVDT